MILVLIALAQAVVSDGNQPHLAADVEGRLYVAYCRGGNIEVRDSTDGGKTFGKGVIAIDASGRFKGGCQRGPRIGVSSTGGVAVTSPACFDEKERENQYPKSEMWVTRSGDKGQAWSKPLRVNEVEKTAAEALHWMAVAPNGDVHVAWLDTRDAGPRANCVWYTRVVGEKVEKNRRLTGAVCPCCAPGLALDEKGNPTIVVRDAKGSDRAILLLSSRDSGKSFSQPAPISTGKTGLDG